MTGFWKNAQTAVQRTNNAKKQACYYLPENVSFGGKVV